MRRRRRCPALADQPRIAVEQRALPDQADRQQVGHGVIRAAGQFRLPQPVAGQLGPAAQRHQQPVEVALLRRLRQRQARGHLPQYIVGAFGRLRYGGGEARQAGDLRRQVMGGDGTPCSIGATATGCRPQCLALVEIAGRPGAQALGDQSGPVDAGSLGRQFGDRRYGARRGRGLRQGRLHRCKGERRVNCRGRRQGRR